MAARRKARLPYTPPRLAPRPLDETDRLEGRARAEAVMDEIDGVKLEDLAGRFGTPLYVVSEAVLRDRYRRFRAAFMERWPTTTAAYSYKTNYIAAVAAVFHQEGAWAEVVSGFEYGIARDLGVPGNRIIFNGPYKKPEELTRALDDGAILNVDSLGELSALEQLVGRRTVGTGSRVGVGLRISMALNDPPWDKFGLSLDGGHARAALAALQRSPYLRLAGLHSHVGTYVTDVSLYQRAAQGLVDLILEVQDGQEEPVEYLDLGGGYATRNTLIGHFLPGAATSPTPEQYAEAATEPLLAARGKFRHPPRLFLEPGRAVVDEAVCLVSTVVSSRRGPDGRALVVLDAGTHNLPTSYWYRHELLWTRPADQPCEPTAVFGPLATQADLIRLEAMLPPLRAGDRLVIRDVGAYNCSQSLQHMYGRPAVVLVGPGKRVDLIRKAEDHAWVRGREHPTGE